MTRLEANLPVISAAEMPHRVVILKETPKECRHSKVGPHQRTIHLKEETRCNE